MARQPEYDHKRWEQEWEENQAYMDNIAQFPKDWWKEDRVCTCMTALRCFVSRGSVRPFWNVGSVVGLASNAEKAPTLSKKNRGGGRLHSKVWTDAHMHEC